MGFFRFHLIGASQPVNVGVDASTIGRLNTVLSQNRFIEGCLVEPDADGVLAGVLIATSRVQCVIELY